MLLWTTCVIALLLTQTVQSQAPQLSDPIIGEVATPSEVLPKQLVFEKKDWDINQTYSDVFKILSSKNSCSDFYGGSRTATMVLNDLVPQIKSEPLVKEVAFKMGGNPRFVRDHSSGVLYRLFDKPRVNVNGSFYRRRTNPMVAVPANVGSFSSGSRPARALILLHELAHLIEGEDGTWLIPDDGFNVEKSTANTSRIEQVCRAQLKAL